MSAYLVHFEDGGDGLNQNCTTDSTSGNTNKVLGDIVHVIPQPGLVVRFKLRQIEVGAKSASNQLFSVVEKVKTKVEEGSRDGSTVDEEMLFIQMPTTSTAD